MTAESRTAKSIKNSIVALAFYFVGLVLQFFSRKIFLDYLGAEVLGLNTTATNLLQFLNLAELGIGAAISFTLYKPLFDNDEKTINEIVSLQGWMYHRIAWIVILGSAVLMCFFPWIFAKMPLPLWYAYASFGVLLVSALLGYFVNYKQILLSADQKDYKIQYSFQSIKLIKICCQIFALAYFDDAYVWWLILELVFAIIGSVSLEWMTRKTYPYLKPNISDGKILYGEYPEIGKKIKQVFFHKIGGFALTQTSPIIIYAYASLTLVALYGNYMLIIAGVTMLMNAMFNSMNAGVGNLVAEGNKERILSVFEELFGIRFILVCTLCFGVYTLAADFITLWIGAEYVLDNTTLALMVATLYITLSRSTVDAFIAAYGLYGDIWAPIVEASINVGFSIILGYFYGLHGILAGVLISLLLVIFCWKPFWLFKRGFKIDILKYVRMYIKYMSIGIIAWVIASLLCSMIKVTSTTTLAFLCKAILFSGIYIFINGLMVMFANVNILRRVTSIVHNKIV